MKYNIEVTEEQLDLLSRATELYARISTGQIYIAIEEVWRPVIFKSNKEFEDKIKKQTNVRNLCKDISVELSDGKHDSWNSSYGIYSPEINPNGVKCYNMHQVLSHQLWKDNETKQQHSVDADVCIITGEEPIKIEKMDIDL